MPGLTAATSRPRITILPDVHELAATALHLPANQSRTTGIPRVRTRSSAPPARFRRPAHRVRTRRRNHPTHPSSPLRPALILTHSVKVCLATRPRDLRKSFDNPQRRSARRTARRSTFPQSIRLPHLRHRPAGHLVSIGRGPLVRAWIRARQTLPLCESGYYPRLGSADLPVPRDCVS